MRRPRIASILTAHIAGSRLNVINLISECARRFPAWPFPLHGAMQLRKMSLSELSWNERDRLTDHIPLLRLAYIQPLPARLGEAH
jgi:hypothetical protein